MDYDVKIMLIAAALPYIFWILTIATAIILIFSQRKLTKTLNKIIEQKEKECTSQKQEQ